MRLTARHCQRRSRTIIAALLGGLVLLLNVLSASPSLHEIFHADAGQAGHQCAVTLFAHGQVDSASVDVPVFAHLIFVESVPAVEFSVFSPAIENLPAGRAPPVSSSNS